MVQCYVNTNNPKIMSSQSLRLVKLLKISESQKIITIYKKVIMLLMTG